MNMRFSVVYEAVPETGFPPGYYYAHIPSLGLTAHGEGIRGAPAAAADLLRLWLAEQQANGERIPTSSDTLFGTFEISEDAPRSA